MPRPFVITAIVACLAAAAFAQDSRPQYITFKETASATEKLTIQKPVGATKSIIFDYAKVYCTVATTATLSIDGTAATTTTLTPTPMNESPVSTALAFRSSNVGAGTVMDTYSVPAATTYTIDLSKFYINNDAVVPRNLTIATDTSSGTCRITIKHYETLGKVVPQQ